MNNSNSLNKIFEYLPCKKPVATFLLKLSESFFEANQPDSSAMEVIHPSTYVSPDIQQPNRMEVTK